MAGTRKGACFFMEDLLDFGVFGGKIALPFGFYDV